MINLSEFTDDPDFFDMAKMEIEREISNLKKITDQVSQMRGICTIDYILHAPPFH